MQDGETEGSESEFIVSGTVSAIHVLQNGDVVETVVLDDIGQSSRLPRASARVEYTETELTLWSCIRLDAGEDE